MVKVEYINDQDYSLSEITLNDLGKWPASKLLKYNLNLKYLTDSDLKIIRNDEYKILVTKHPFTTSKEYAKDVFAKLIKQLIIFPVIFTFVGFLIGYFTYFKANNIFSTLQYTVIFYFLFSAALYFASLFSLQIVSENIMRNKLDNCGRLLFPNELTRGLTSQFCLAWLFIQFFTHVTMYFICNV